MSSERALEILKNWKMASSCLESNSISLFKPGRSRFVRIEDVSPSVLVVSDDSGWETIQLVGTEHFDGIEPTEFSVLRALQITCSDGKVVLFIEKAGSADEV
jgi:hypothetical protein